MSATMTTAAFLAAHQGAVLIHTAENGDKINYTVTSLDDKKSGGKMSDNFLLLTNVKTNETKVISPSVVKRVAMGEDKEWALAKTDATATADTNQDADKAKETSMDTNTNAAPAAAGNVTLDVKTEGEASAAPAADPAAALAVAAQALNVADHALAVAASTGAADATPAADTVQAAAPAPAAEKAADGAQAAPAVAPIKIVSKKDRAFEIFNRIDPERKGDKRKDIITAMKAELGMSAEGAATYYQNIKSAKWVEKKADAAAPAATDTTASEAAPASEQQAAAEPAKQEGETSASAAEAQPAASEQAAV